MTEEKKENVNPNQLIVLCEHCLTKVSGAARFCPTCDTEPKRQAMDEENRKLFESKGLVHKCRYHIKKAWEKQQKELRENIIKEPQKNVN